MNADDAHTCAECSKPIEGEPVRRGQPPAEVRHFHPGCWETCKQRHEAERTERIRRDQVERERKDRLRHFDYVFALSCCGSRAAADVWHDAEGNQIYAVSGGPLTFPDWRFARDDNEDFNRRTSPMIRASLADYEPERDGNKVIIGQTGRGKSARVVAWIIRRRDQLRVRVDAGEKLAMRFAWITGYELSGSRKRSPLGEEATLVKLATETQLLILDEVGHEPQSEEIMHVIDARYRMQRPTILTSPLEWKQLAAHLGGGAYRRLLEHGELVDVHGEKAALRSVR